MKSDYIPEHHGTLFIQVARSCLVVVVMVLFVVGFVVAFWFGLFFPKEG